MKKRTDNDWILNKAEYLRNFTTVHSLLLNYQYNYNSNRPYQFQGVSNQLMFAQSGETGDNDGEKKMTNNLPK